MSFIDELATLSDDFVRGLGADTTVTVLKRTRGTYNAATQVHAADTVDQYAVTRFVRSAGRQSTISTGQGFIRVEEFTISITVADLVTAGWTNDGTNPIDERWEVMIGTTVWPVVGVERECGEKLLRILVRTDVGRQA